MPARSIRAALLASSVLTAADLDTMLPQVSFDRRPSVRFGDVLRIELRVTVQNDVRQYSRPLGAGHPVHELNRARLGVEGRLFSRIEFEVEREFTDSRDPWRDAFVNVKFSRGMRLKGGRFKLPFSQDQLTSAANLDFIYRSRAAAYLSPARDNGLSVHGRLFERGLGYEAGVFRADGDNARNAENRPTGGVTVAGRIHGTPLALTDAPALLRNMDLGLGFTTSSVDEGLNSPRGRTTARTAFFHRLAVSGRRNRLGGELRWTPGPFRINAEWIQLRDQRLGQGLLGEVLPDLVARGWYLSTAWKVPGRVSARHPLWLAVRQERLRFQGAAHPGDPSRSPRAANIFPNGNQATTLGVTCRIHRYARLQYNAIHEQMEDPQRGAAPDARSLWSSVARFQVGF